MIYDKDTIVFLPKPTIHNFIDLEGQTFTDLTVRGFAGTVNQRAIWWCECVCGKILIRQGKLLMNGHQKSCGCRSSKVTATRNTTHGLSGVPEYVSWMAMHTRCKNPKQKRAHRYIDRGIVVCGRWKDFANFYADMGKKPTSAHSLERVDNDKGYAPDNCIWATMTEQANNTSRNHMVTFNGKTQSLRMWCRELHLNYSTITCRLSRGHWSVEKALSQPIANSQRL